jgi:hypothetical protein
VLGRGLYESWIVALGAEMALIALARFMIACRTLLWFNKDSLVFSNNCLCHSILYSRLLMSWSRLYAMSFANMCFCKSILFCSIFLVVVLISLSPWTNLSLLSAVALAMTAWPNRFFLFCPVPWLFRQKSVPDVENDKLMWDTPWGDGAPGVAL